MCLRFVFLLITRLAAWQRLSRREAWKTAEILILRHQLAVLQSGPAAAPRCRRRSRTDSSRSRGQLSSAVVPRSSPGPPGTGTAAGSKQVGVATWRSRHLLPHMPNSGRCGLSRYARIRIFRQPEMTSGSASIRSLGTPERCSYVLSRACWVLIPRWRLAWLVAFLGWRAGRGAGLRTRQGGAAPGVEGKLL